mmetsp:Transcript_15881/g.24166  ORF Transcript_15881/g.24166 Transcript_15881/m.24166 type:complete len:168 (-) Transcript_15881:1023-1526(-)
MGSLETECVKKLDACCSILSDVAHSTKTNESEETKKQPPNFENLMSTYFKDQTVPSSAKFGDEGTLLEFDFDSKRLREDLVADLESLRRVQMWPINNGFQISEQHQDYVSLALAKALHALDSRVFPSMNLKGHPVFGKWQRYRFSQLLLAINQIVLEENRGDRKQSI